MHLKRLSDQVLEVSMTYKAGEKFTFLLQSDIHFDNPKCDRAMYFRHLNEAKERNAKVLTFGDFFCLMQGRNDRRGGKSDVRPEHNKADYFDRVIFEAEEELKPYKDMLIMMGNGNHETAVVKNVETNPLARLCKYLQRDGSQVQHMPYQGFVRFKFTHDNAASKRASATRSKLMFFHHGKYGGAVTKGTLGTQRYSVIVPQADLIVSGHNHERWVNSNTQYMVNRSGKVDLRTVYHLNCPTYKNEFTKGDGFAVERIVSPKPMGGWWLTLKPSTGGGVKVNYEIAD